MKSLITITLMLMHMTSAVSNVPSAVVNGTKDHRHTVQAFINATIFTSADGSITNATMLVKDEEILAVGKDVQVPSHAHVHDLKGAHIYPGFILMDSDYGLPDVPQKKPFSFGGKEILNSTQKGAYNANEAIKASYRAVREFHHDSEKAKSLRKNGFSTVLSLKHDGIMRGTSVLVNLDDKADQQSIIEADQAFHLSFDKGSSKQLYPVSLMGSSALLRQSWLDAKWYDATNEEFTDLDLQAIIDNQPRLQIFDVNNWQQALLANKLALEFNKNIIIKTAGDAYKHIDAIKKMNRSLIVPLAFAKAVEVSDELSAWNSSLEDMMQWEASPYNMLYLHNNGVTFSIIPKDHKTFLKDLRKVVKKGLPQSAALAALTSVPAKMLGKKQLGNLQAGAQANFIITAGDLFEDDMNIAENWVAGQRFVLEHLPALKSGLYQLSVNGDKHMIELKNKAGKLSAKSQDKDNKAEYKIKRDNNFVHLEITHDDKSTRLLGVIDRDSMRSIKGQSPQWSAEKSSDASEKAEKSTENKSTDEPPVLPKPFSSYGLHKAEEARSFLITNATVWTNEKEGILKNTDVFLNDGKIVKIGKNLAIKADKIIDGSGMHLTAGIIDEHSHIALLSVNDIAVNSSMVRMEDAIDSDDVQIYRNLAGGVTAAQLLHGSANPIGGQSALVKMRWGGTSNEMLIDDADGFIKFALGENVKRSSSSNSIRYPLTRMGVEQVFRDAFNNALAYEQQWKAYKNASNKEKLRLGMPRKDLMMEATLEVIRKNRFVSSHSYVQSEINMLMKVAEDYGFNINTFTHILEGYKVADKMQKHGVGASTFADWWAYKWEVNYAIPYNASIMTEAGVVTAINSDDDEMARRLNQEAAKSLKYGGMSEQEAWKMVTLNPAKLLHLDDRMGSIKQGKDADVVLWSNNPLSIYAKADKTFVDGRLLFDRDRQAEIEAGIEQHRARLIGKINQSDEKKMPSAMKPRRHMECESIHGYEHLLGAVE